MFSARHLRVSAMGLNKVKLGELITLSEEKNSNDRYGIDDVRGITTQKEFIPTKANMAGVSLSNYKIVKPEYFAYVSDTSRRGNKISLAYNSSESSYLVSSLYIVFYVSASEILDSDFLFMYFNRPEFDRYSRFNSWGSARETFSWEDMCDIEIEVPDIPTQKKYVDIYLGMQENLDAMMRGIEQLQHAYGIYLDKVVHSSKRYSIGDYIEETDVRNVDESYSPEDVMGMTITKEIIPTKADVARTDLKNFKIVFPGEFVYNPRTHGKHIGLGYNDGKRAFIISWNNAAFKIRDSKKDELVSEYLYLCFSRSEWDRDACFRSWGSSTEVFSWDALCEMQIAIPDRRVQEDIVGIYKAYKIRKQLAKRLIKLQKNICPILVRGAIEEGGR